jgi:hypothetical protein
VQAAGGTPHVIKKEQDQCTEQREQGIDGGRHIAFEVVNEFS